MTEKRYFTRITIEGVTNGIVVKHELVDAADGTCEKIPTVSIYKTFDELVVGLAHILLSTEEAQEWEMCLR